MLQKEHFDKDLSLLLDIARTEYKILLVDDRNHQVGMLKTYLWLSTVMAAAMVSAGNTLVRDGGFLLLPAGRWGPLVSTFGGISLILALVVFALGIYTLRGRKDINVFGDFKHMHGVAQKAQQDNDPFAFRLSTLRFLDATISDQTKETSLTGRRLRKMSWMLLGSALCGALAVAAFVVG